MVNYALLGNPGHNRVYFEESKKLSVSELKIAAETMSVHCYDMRELTIADIFYIGFSADTHLSEDDIKILSRLSFVYAIFELTEHEDKTLLLPIPWQTSYFIDTDISTILKYSGKTNELFTRMMINVAEMSCTFNESHMRLLDPIAGKGTTLYEGLTLGHDVYGIEIGTKTVKESYHFLKKYLETKKYKHTSKIMRASGKNKSFTATKHMLDIARTKDEVKSDRQRHAELVSGNSMYTNAIYTKNYFHMIVGDLPYGVQHGNVTNEKQSSMTRNPKQLLVACLKSWYDVLKPGGVIVLAWNTHVLPRPELTEIFRNAGFAVFDDEVYLEFEHPVDRSIQRDIIVAKKAHR